jgi:hypothetical protein
VRPLIAVALVSCSTLVSSGRIVNEPCFHLGVRPAKDNGYAATVQITTDWPQCFAVDGGK